MKKAKTRSKKKDEREEALEEKLKYEIAQELGLTEKIMEVGWGGLTAKESGRIGGLITAKRRKMEKKGKDV